MTRFRRSRAVLAALAAAAVAGASVTACNAQAAQSNGGTTVALVVPTTAMSWMLPSLAKSIGSFRAEHINPQITVTGTGPLTVQAVDAGSAPIGFDVLNLTLAATAKGQQLVNFGKVYRQWDGQLVVSKRVYSQHRIGSLKTTTAKLRALKGLTIAVVAPASGDDLLLRSQLKAAGVNPDHDVRITYITDPAATTAALRAGRIDGFMRATPVPQLATESGLAMPVLNLATAEPRGLFCGVLFAQRSWLASHRQLAVRVIKALDAAAAYQRQHPQAAEKLVRAALGAGLPAGVFTSSYQSTLRQAVPKVSPITQSDFQINLNFARASGTAGSVVFSRVVDNSLLP
jgi:ABC-type nitrate/sulfonate/bicarbonate transport system substrate-binding protein